MSRMYIVGDRLSGVLFIKTDPLKVTHISKSTIETYASSHGKTFDAVFAEIAAGAKAILNKTQVQPSMPDLESSYEAIGSLIGGGATLSDAEFCFLADINDADWSAKRVTVPPLASALASLNPSTAPDVELREGNLD